MGIINIIAAVLGAVLLSLVDGFIYAALPIIILVIAIFSFYYHQSTIYRVLGLLWAIQAVLLIPILFGAFIGAVASGESVVLLRLVLVTIVLCIAIATYASIKNYKFSAANKTKKV